MSDDDVKQFEVQAALDRKTPLEVARAIIAAAEEDVEKVFAEFGYTFHSSFSEEPDIKFWVNEDEGFELHGRYQCPAPCIDIDSDLFWQYENDEGDLTGDEGTGAESLRAFLEKKKNEHGVDNRT